MVERALLALAVRWRSRGEYWRGTPEHAAFQDCADDLLRVLGLSKQDAFAMTHEEAERILRALGLGVHLALPEDRHRGG